MIRELQQFEKLDVSVEGCDAYLEKLRKDCNDLTVKVHNLGAVNDELLLHVTGIKCKSNSYRKVNGASAKFFCCNTPTFQTFKTHKLSPENLLNVDIRHTCAFATICWEHQCLTNYCFSRINSETY